MIGSRLPLRLSFAVLLLLTLIAAAATMLLRRRLDVAALPTIPKPVKIADEMSQKVPQHAT
jgi:hypothetical protein